MSRRRGDALPIIDVVQSIMDLRRIYSEKDEETFCAWYAARYGVQQDTVKKVLKRKRAKAKG